MIGETFSHLLFQQLSHRVFFKLPFKCFFLNSTNSFDDHASFTETEFKKLSVNHVRSIVQARVDEMLDYISGSIPRKILFFINIYCYNIIM